MKRLLVLLGLLAAPVAGSGAGWSSPAGLTVLLDLESRPWRILAAFPGEAPAEHLWPRRIQASDGVPLAESLARALENESSKSATVVALASRVGADLVYFLLPERLPAFSDVVRSDELSGGLRPGRDLRLVHLPVDRGARFLVLGTAALVPPSGKRSGDRVRLDYEVAYRLDAGRDADEGAKRLAAPSIVPLPPPPPAPSATVTRLAGKRPPASSYDIVFVGDGYQAGELAALRARIADFTTRLLGVPGDCAHPGIAPFSDPEVRDLVSVYLVEIPSTDSHVTFCPCCAEVKRTALQVRGNFTNIGIQTDYDSDDPAAVEAAFASLGVPLAQLEGRVVVPNCEVYGGRGYYGTHTAYVSPVPDLAKFASLVVHEMSHATIGLGDEYLACAVERDFGSWPMPNIATPADVAAGRIRWAKPPYARPDELDAGTGSLRVRHDCGQPPPTGADAAALGLFWGALFIDLPAPPCACDLDSDPDPRVCGYYRPMLACKMKALAAPFCRVCAHELRCDIRRAAGVQHPDCGP